MKIKTMKTHKMSVRVVGMRLLKKEYESQALVLRGDLLDIDKTLSTFSHYTRHDELLGGADVAVLFTGREAVSFKKGTNPNHMGLAYMGSVCDQQFKVAVVEDKGAVYQASISLPHEIGHLLGAPHDGAANKKYPKCPTFGAIMAPKVEGSSGHHFSECSESAIKDNLEKMSDNKYWNCICVRNLLQDFLEVQKRLPPPTYTPDDFCRATEGSNFYYSELTNCILHCYHGGFWSGYPGQHYPAPYGFRCERGKICIYGQCVPCKEYWPGWKDCEKY